MISFRKLIAIGVVAGVMTAFSAGAFAQSVESYNFNKVGNGYHCYYDNDRYDNDNNWQCCHERHHRNAHCW